MFKIPKRNIIFDCLGVRIGEQRGAERFICEIITELAAMDRRDWLLLINKSSLKFIRRRLPPSQYLLVPIAGRNRVGRMFVQMTLGPVIARRAGASLYVSSSVFPTLGFPCPTSAVLYDLMLYHFPGEFKRAVWLFRTMLLRASIPTLSSVVTISRASAEDIENRFGKSARSVHIVPCAGSRVAPPVSAESQQIILGELGLTGRKFVLSVLGGGMYKNPHGLAEAAQRLTQRGRGDIDIIVVGDAHKLLRTIPHPQSLRALGFVSDEVLSVLYANADALVCPTLFEGFGIPVIEAQAAGLPVICSDIPVLREVGGEAALFFDPHQPDDIADAIVKVTESGELRKRLIEAGRKNAASFTWNRSAKRFLETCDAIMGKAELAEDAAVTSA